jgi:hypothetical protein
MLAKILLYDVSAIRERGRSLCDGKRKTKEDVDEDDDAEEEVKEEKCHAVLILTDLVDVQRTKRHNSTRENLISWKGKGGGTRRKK